jgi:putative transcriptional regulator
VPAETGSHVVCHLDRMLDRRGMTLAELARAVGVTVVNLSVLKNDRARAVRFSTLAAVCDALDCQPGDLFTVVPSPPAHPLADQGIRARSAQPVEN